jgi:Fe-S cluster biogenesis protein NfuA
MATLKQKIEKTIEEIINPRLTMHSGGIELVSVDEKKGIATIKFSGMCVGCPMAGMTFEGLVEAELMSEVPELTQIVNIEEEI